MPSDRQKSKAVAQETTVPTSPKKWSTSLRDESLSQQDRPWISRDTAQMLDDRLAGVLGRISGGIALPRIGLAYADWAVNLALSPGRQLEIAERLVRSALPFGRHGPASIEDDPRFASEHWKRRPFKWMAKSALRREAFWEMATAPLPGMNRHNADLVRFYTKQLIEATSPAHWFLTNPDVLAQTRAKRGMNLLTGAGRVASRALKQLSSRPEESEQFRVGENLAATSGTVVYRNELMELIQYKPVTQTVLSEPIVIVPAWIMKYYILDLSTQNSLVRWLVEKGHTVFMVSWKNPDASDRDRGMDDYYRLGVQMALEIASSTCGGARVHAVGYCVGGTLLAMAAARMAKRQDSPIKTLTLFTAQTDFQDAGELGIFINEMNVYWLDRQMSKRGYLEGGQMATAFGLLRARELIWSDFVQKYLVGAETSTFDVMAWNADVTRMPHRMHSDYLRELYIENRLSQGKYQLDGASISIGDISAPLFAVSTTNDHIAPWKSVYKIRNLKRRGETTFVLAAGGHNTGIVSEPGRPRRRFQLGSWDEETTYQSPAEWEAAQPYIEGSWWPAWQAWLEEHSKPERRKPPKPAGDICAAPGTYVFQR